MLRQGRGGGQFRDSCGGDSGKGTFRFVTPFCWARDAKFVWVLAGKTPVVLLIAHCAILKKLSLGNNLLWMSNHSRKIKGR